MSICMLTLLSLACAESRPPESTDVSGVQATTAQPIHTSIPLITTTTAAPPNTTATTAAPAATTTATTAIATTTTTTTTTTTRPPIVCWDGSTTPLRVLCPPEPKWESLSDTDAFGDPISVAMMVSDDAAATVILACSEDVLSVFVVDWADFGGLTDSTWRPDAPGGSSGRYRGGGQESATNVRWQTMVMAAGEPTIRGVFLPKSYRRDFIDSLRSGDSLIIDWFYSINTFEWPETDRNYESPLEACGW